MKPISPPLHCQWRIQDFDKGEAPEAASGVAELRTYDRVGGLCMGGAVHFFAIIAICNHFLLSKLCIMESGIN